MSTEREPRVGDFLVLLGAGNSAAAGIPLASELTRRALDEMDVKRRCGYDFGGPVPRALEFVIAAIRLEDIRRGLSGQGEPSIERVVSAVELLAKRADLEVAPFIRDWDPLVVGLETVRPAIQGHDVRRLQDALQVPRSPFAHLSGFADPVTDAVRSLIEHGTQERQSAVFDHLHRWLTAQVVHDVALDSVESARYLAPLVHWAHAHAATVATLNYDLAMESAASLAAIEIDRAVDDWESTGELRAKCIDRLRLLKLHGSADWSFDRGNRLCLTISDGMGTPALVYGQREKLRPHGPFLQLLEAFRTDLSAATRLIVIGYSFQDEHINVLLQRWLDRDPENTALVVDPNFPDLLPNSWASPAPTRETFWRTYGPNRRQPDSGQPTAPQFWVRRDTAEEFVATLETSTVRDIFSDAPTAEAPS